MNIENELQEVQTSTVKNKNHLSRLILVIAYLFIWVFSLIVFWFFTSGSNVMGYSFIFLWILLPSTTFVVSLLIGKDNYFGKWKWLSTIIFGIMYMLAEYATFQLANMMTFHKINLPSWELILIGAIVSAIGLGIGSSIYHINSKHEKNLK